MKTCEDVLFFTPHFLFLCGRCGFGRRAILVAEQSELSRFQYHVSRDRSSGPRTVAAALDDDRDSDLWFFKRGDSDEPAVRAVVKHGHLVLLSLARCVLASLGDRLQ